MTTGLLLILLVAIGALAATLVSLLIVGIGTANLPPTPCSRGGTGPRTPSPSLADQSMMPLSRGAALGDGQDTQPPLEFLDLQPVPLPFTAEPFRASFLLKRMFMMFLDVSRKILDFSETTE